MPEKNKSWSVPIEAYVSGGNLYKRAKSERLVFGRDSRWKKYYVRRGATERLHVPKEAAGVAAICFRACNIHYDEYYVRLIPIVSDLLTGDESEIIDLQLPNCEATRALKANVQTMDNFILHDVQRSFCLLFLLVCETDLMRPEIAGNTRSIPDITCATNFGTPLWRPTRYLSLPQ